MIDINKDKMEIFREWIRSEIDIKIAQTNIDSDGYYSSAHNEKKEADRLFLEVCKILGA